MAGMGTQGGTSERLAPDENRLFPRPMPKQSRDQTLRYAVQFSLSGSLYGDVVYLMRRRDDERV